MKNTGELKLHVTPNPLYKTAEAGSNKLDYIEKGAVGYLGNPDGKDLTFDFVYEGDVLGPNTIATVVLYASKDKVLISGGSVYQDAKVTLTVEMA